MRQLSFAVVLVAMVAFAPVSAARACINDSETIRTESDFKKHYEFKSGYQPSEQPSYRSSDGFWAFNKAGGFGLAFVVGAVGLVTMNARKLLR